MTAAEYETVITHELQYTAASLYVNEYILSYIFIFYMCIPACGALDTLPPYCRPAHRREVGRQGRVAESSPWRGAHNIRAEQTCSETSEVGDLCLSFYQRQAESGRLFAHRGDLTGTAPLGIFFGTQIAKWGAMFEQVIDDARYLVGRSHNG
jgi:hypothetical protein